MAVRRSCRRAKVDKRRHLAIHFRRVRGKPFSFLATTTPLNAQKQLSLNLFNVKIDHWLDNQDHQVIKFQEENGFQQSDLLQELEPMRTLVTARRIHTLVMRMRIYHLLKRSRASPFIRSTFIDHFNTTLTIMICSRTRETVVGLRAVLRAAVEEWQKVVERMKNGKSAKAEEDNINDWVRRTKYYKSCEEMQNVIT